MSLSHIAVDNGDRGDRDSRLTVLAHMLLPLVAIYSLSPSFNTYIAVLFVITYKVVPNSLPVIISDHETVQPG